MIEMFSYTFMQNAFVLIVLASVSCGVVGSLITVNRMSSFTGSIAHASFGGLGLAYLLGVHPMLGATVFAVGSALGIGALSERSRLGSDTAMAALWATGMAAGLVFIKLSGTYTSDLMSWLFGSLMAVSRTDIYLTGVLGVLVTGSVFLLYKEFLGISYDLEFTRIQGVSVKFVRGLFLVMAALTTIVLMKVTGLIMVIAMLTIPAAIAEKFSSSLWKMMILASIFSLVFSVVGLFVSWWLDLPSGPVIILVSSVVFFAVQTAGRNSS
ncbi:MAG: metal ABC transporter permease [Candidatus Fermentibacteraceae bacterium]|nr:metal ABC transporter permease [Candidatus Fermentibacteraceae bacterium]